ncbi:hypothetical protein ACFY5D_16640 [Paeniglutamicibacter sp. NPDC012692]|uniref:hypothetical protein n=1 Tax=Paeniglutamicibacter sp. NPDC012692 TaxID=3364388 RepID=UPI00369873AB
MKIKIGNVEAGGNTGKLIITEYAPGATDVRTNYVDRPNGDGQMVGNDWLGSSTWAFDISTNTKNLKEAADAVASLEGEWKKPGTRLTPNVPVPLSYSNDDGTSWYRIYGRPGKFTGMAPNVLATLGVGKVNADFVQTIPLHFEDTEQVETMAIVPPVQGGLMAPLMEPLTTIGTGLERAGFVENTGNAPTPMTIVFHGPIQNPKIRSAKGWEVGYRGTIAAGDYVTINPLLGTVKTKNGTNVAGMLTVKTRLSAVTLPVGKSEMFYTGTDTTNTATAQLKWRNAFISMQA